MGGEAVSGGGTSRFEVTVGEESSASQKDQRTLMWPQEAWEACLRREETAEEVSAVCCVLTDPTRNVSKAM